MPRKARIDAPGALHHIIFRGIEGTAIFKDALDYRNFIERLGIILEETNTPCFAWALLTNHVHLLLRTGLAPISTVMRRLLTGYAQQFNRRHKRSGHLFQNRYKSFLCEAVDKLKISGAAVARKLELSPSAVSKLASRGRQDVLASKIAARIFGFNSLKDRQVMK